MTNNDDFRDLPELGPAGDELDLESVVIRNGKAEVPRAAKRGGGRGLLWLVLLLLFGTAGLGGWGYLEFAKMQRQMAVQQQHIEQQSAMLGLASQRMPELENLISSADESISKSGKALQSQINELEELQADRSKLVDSELAKLWALANQRNKSQLEAQEKSLKALSEDLKALSGRSDALERAQQAQTSGSDQLRQTLQGLEKGLQPLRQALRGLEQQLQAGSQAQAQTAERLQAVAQADEQLHKRAEVLDQQIEALSRRLDQVPTKLPVPAELTRKLNDIEQAIDAIDGFRRQTNQDLLQLKRRLNRMQLSLEQLAPAAQ